MKRPDKTKKFVRVVRVVRGNSKKAIWVRISYIERTEKDGVPGERVLHDVAFIPSADGWVYKFQNFLNNFIPDKRYHKMAKRAAAILYEKKK